MYRCMANTHRGINPGAWEQASCRTPVTNHREDDLSTGQSGEAMLVNVLHTAGIVRKAPPIFAPAWAEGIYLDIPFT